MISGAYFMTQDNTLDLSDIRIIVSDLGARYGADRIYLFGSYARGDQGPESDIDLRIDWGNICGWDAGGLYCDLEDSLGKKVDLISTKCLREDFLDSIRNEEILLYEKP